MEKKGTSGWQALLRKYVLQLRDWVQPDPGDPPLLRVLKLFYKSIAILLLIAFSPVILVVLAFVFFAAI
jgi:hypothetical protein